MKVFRAVVPLLLIMLSGREVSAAGNVTFNNQIVRILQQHCQTCHRPGNIAPFSLLTYQDAQIHASSILSAVRSRVMPPWKPLDPHGTFEGERTLSDSEIEAISQWVADGVPEGKSGDQPDPIAFPETWSAGTPNAVTQPSGAFPLQAGADDIYRCFPMAVPSSSDLYVRGYEVLPGNRSIVHHVLLFIDANGQSPALDDADPGPGYTCFGGAGFNNGLGGIGGWVPGSHAEMFPLGTGVRIPAGARIVMQVHYSTSEISSAAGPLDPDLTRLGLYFSPTPLQEMSFLPVVNPFFSIPAGDPHYEVKAYFPIFSTVELQAIAPHMHLLGREMTVVARFPDGSTRQLVRIGDWDFHWQGGYTYRTPITLPRGTLIELTAYYDNSADNPKNPSSPPVVVSWGERTTDEMCLAFLTVKAPGVPSMNTVPYSLTGRGTESVTTEGSDQDSAQVGFVRVGNTNGAAPAGLAVLGYRQNGVLISEAGAPAARLLAKGRFYSETNATVRTGLAIANPNSEPAVVSLAFIDENGREVFSSSAAIDANSQRAAFLNEAPFNGPSSFSGAVTLTSNRPVAVAALRQVMNERAEVLLSASPIVDLGAAGPEATSFPQFADGGGWTTSVLLVNPTDNDISGALQFSDATGVPGLLFNYLIHARSGGRFTTSGSGNTVRSGAVSIVPSSGDAAPDGSLVLTYRKAGVRVTEAAIPASRSGTSFRVYIEAADTVQSGIAIVNSAAASATIRLELINLSGVSISTTTVTVEPRAQLAKFLNELPGFQNLSLPIQGLLQITSSAPVAVAGLRSRLNERGDFLIMTTPPITANGTATPELLFPHFADGAGYRTQFIMFGDGSQNSLEGTMRFFSQSGQALNLKVK